MRAKEGCLIHQGLKIQLWIVYVTLKIEPVTLKYVYAVSKFLYRSTGARKKYNYTILFIDKIATCINTVRLTKKVYDWRGEEVGGILEGRGGNEAWGKGEGAWLRSDAGDC